MDSNNTTNVYIYPVTRSKQYADPNLHIHANRRADDNATPLIDQFAQRDADSDDDCWQEPDSEYTEYRHGRRTGVGDGLEVDT